MEQFPLWLFVSFLFFLTCASFSTALSVYFRGSMNFLIIFLGLLIWFLLRVFLPLSSSWTSQAILSIMKYGLPPVEMLGELPNVNPSGMTILAHSLHCLFLVLVYSVAGIARLATGQYRCAATE